MDEAFGGYGTEIEGGREGVLMQVGFGYDAHKLVPGRKLILGGVEIKHPKGLLGWSDGDVLLHAIIDAVIGAMGEGDIGKHFPPGDLRFKGIASLRLMEFMQELLRVRGFAINNIDTTVVAQEPLLSPYIEEMKSKISKSLGINPSQINVKGKTEEGLGFTGKKQGIAAYAICLLHREA